MSVNYFSTRRTIKCFSFLFYCFLFTFFVTSTKVIAQQPSLNKNIESTFTANLVNIESTVDKVFRFTTTLENNTSQDEVFELLTDTPTGWRTVFKTQGNQITSIKVNSGKKETINLELYPSYGAKPSKYDISVTAKSATESIQLGLEAVVSGAYNLEITTPTGRLSDKITEGKRKEIQLVVKNTASLTLNDIDLSAKTPPHWSAVFEPSKIEKLDPGETKNITATLTVPDKTIAGDYMTTFTAKNANTKDEAVFRMSVVTSLTSGIIGGLVILAAIALVYFLIRKYGRR